MPANFIEPVAANISLDEAISLVNAMPFPFAVVGEHVKQYDFWFVLTADSGWVHDPNFNP